MIKKTEKKEIRSRVHQRIRRKLRGTAERPRLAVFRSLAHIYAQVVDDVNGKTVAHASTLSREVRTAITASTKVDAAKSVGQAIAKLLLEKGVDSVVFDRNGYLYHGRVRALADAARAAGLKF